VLLGTLHRYSNSRSSDTSSMVVERKSDIQRDESRVGGDESRVYAIADVLLSLQVHFGLLSECWILRYVCFLGDIPLNLT